MSGTNISNVIWCFSLPFMTLGFFFHVIDLMIKRLIVKIIRGVYILNCFINGLLAALTIDYWLIINNIWNMLHIFQ